MAKNYNQWITDFSEWREQEIQRQYFYTAFLAIAGVPPILQYYKFDTKYFWIGVGISFSSGALFILFLKPLRSISPRVQQNTEGLVEFIDEHLTAHQLKQVLKEYIKDLNNWKTFILTAFTYLPMCFQSYFPPLRFKLLLATSTLLMALQNLSLNYIVKLKGVSILKHFLPSLKNNELSLLEEQLNEVLENPQNIIIEARNFSHVICAKQLEDLKVSRPFIVTNKMILQQENFKKRFEKFYQSFKFPSEQKLAITEHLLEAISLSRKMKYSKFFKSMRVNNETLYHGTEDFIEEDYQNIFKVWKNAAKHYHRPSSLPLPLNLYKSLPFLLVGLGKVDLYSLIFLIAIIPINYQQVNNWRIVGLFLTLYSVIFSINELKCQNIYLAPHKPFIAQLVELKNQTQICATKPEAPAVLLPTIVCPETSLTTNTSNNSKKISVA